MLDMLQQLIPAKNIALGSHKVFRKRFRPALERINKDSLKKYILTTTRSAYKVMILWAALIAALGLLKYWGILTDAHLFLVSVLFYVCDLIYVLIWELCVLLYPERFWEKSNTALKCAECTDKLCIQYCQKLRRK